MASKNKDERAHVNELVKILLGKEARLYVEIDRDAGSMRNTSSGYDFQMSLNGRIVYCEAKEENGKLSSWQQLVKAKIEYSNTPYRVIRFWQEGKFFTIDDGKMIAISDAKFNDFL